MLFEYSIAGVLDITNMSVSNGFFKKYKIKILD